MHYVDVDGDGRDDTVQLSWIRLEDPVVGRGVVRLVVRLASGLHSTLRVEVNDWTDYHLGHAVLPWAGAAAIVPPGRQILLGYSQGAHSEMFTAVRWTGSRLEVLPSPTNLGAGQKWFINSSVGTGDQGYLCTGTDLKMFAVEGNSGPETIWTYRWQSERWRLLATQHVAHPTPPNVGFGCVGVESW